MSSEARGSQTASFRNAAVRPNVHQPELPDGEELRSGFLTQFGTDYFRASPRFGTEFDVSALVGRLSLTQTVYAVLGRAPKPEHRHRHFDVNKLVAADYRCLDTGWIGNPQHASILAGCPGDDIQIHQQWWAHPRRLGLDSLAESEVS